MALERPKRKEKLRKIAYFFGASLRYLQFRNGNLISAHGGCLGDYNRYVKLLGEIKKYRGGDEVSNLGFSRLNGARMSIIIDTSPPLYGKRYGIAHAGFSSFELYYGAAAIFVNCGGGNRFGQEYRKYCQSSKAHNVLLLNEKSQCSFGKKPFSRNNSYYYVMDGPRNTKLNCENSITEKIVELSHDAYKKDYGISVNRRLSMDLVYNCVKGQDSVFPEHRDPKKNLIDSSVSLYFHVHPSISCKKKRNGVLLQIPGDKNSTEGHNVRGTYWTIPDEKGKEVERDKAIDESKYTEIVPEFKKTYFEEVYNTLKKHFKLGRVRILLKEPRSTLSWHRDPEPRLHIPIITNKGCRMVIEEVCRHMPADGSVWITNNTKYHNAFNGGEENRIHLVACVLDYKFN